MKKKLFCLILAALVGVSLCACSNNNQDPSNDATAIEVPDDTEDAIIDETLSDTETETAQEPMDLEEEPAVSDIEKDPLDPLIVTEDIAKEFGGFYLYRNGNLYSLNKFISIEKAQQYNIGWRWNETVGAVSYRARASNTGDMISMGDIPLATIEEGDEIRGYKNAEMGLDKATFAGYSLIIFNDGNGAYLFSDLEEEPVVIEDLSTLQIEDKDGNIIPTEDMHNLNYLETYKVTWYENQTEYREASLVADCHFYNTKDRTYGGGDYDYVIEGELTQNGYAIFDLSEVEPGIYQNTKGGLFEVK